MTTLSVLTDYSTEALTAATFENTKEFFEEVCPRIPEGDRVEVDGNVAFFTGVPFPPFNSVVSPSFAEESADASIEELVEQARARKLPMLWLPSPSVTRKQSSSRRTGTAARLRTEWRIHCFSPPITASWRATGTAPAGWRGSGGSPAGKPLR
jgi:hypothetical protein